MLIPKCLAGITEKSRPSSALPTFCSFHLAFLAAYETRIRLRFEKLFYLDFPVATLLLIISILCWIAIGYWFNIYEKLDSAHPRVVLRDTFRQCALGAISLVVAEYMLRLDLSRSFVALFAIYAWVLLCLFRINFARAIGDRAQGVRHRAFRHGGGIGQNARGIWERRWNNRSDYGIRLMGFLDDEPGQVELSQDLPAVSALATSGTAAPARDRRNHFRRGQPQAGGAGRSLPALR